MSSGCGGVLSLEDLKTAKLHQIFEAEVITGKSGGVAGGSSIDYATNLVTGQVQKTMPAIMRDIGFEPASFDFQSGGTLTVNDRNKAVLWPSASGGDGFWYYWEGALPKVIPAASSPATTGGVAAGAWRPLGDVTLRDDLAASSGANQIGYGSTTVGAELNAITGPDGADEIGYGAATVGDALDTLTTAAIVPDNCLLFPAFRNQNDVSIYFHHALKGLAFQQVSDETMKVNNQTWALAGRDPSIVWFNGKWHMAVTWFVLNDFDTVIYTSDDLVSWDFHKITLGSSLIGSATVPAPGATHPCDQIWGPALFVENNTLYMGLSLPFGADAVDVNGTTIPDFRQYISTCTNSSTLTFSTPVLVNQTGNTRCQIDGSFYKVNGVWHMLSKNDYSKDVQDWTSTGSDFFGPYTLNRTIIAGTTYQTEGPKLVVMNGDFNPKYRIYTDSYTEGCYRVTTSNDFATWSSPAEVPVNRSVRHGDIINVGSLPRAAQESVAAFLSFGATVPTINRVQVTSNNATFTPQDGVNYWVSGTDRYALTIGELSCQEFKVTIASLSPVCRLTINVSPYFDGLYSGLPLVLDGAFYGNRVITFKRFGNKFVCDADAGLNQTSIGLATVNPGLSFTNFAPIVGALYTTNGTATYASTANFESILTTYPDGAYFYIQRQNETATNGNIFFRGGVASMSVPAAGFTISRTDLQIIEVRKIAGVWRIMA